MSNILIVGADSNIGSRIAEFFLDKADNLILWGYDAIQRLEKIRKKRGSVKIISADISDETAVNKIFSGELSETTIDTFINCATLRSSDFQALPETDSHLWKRITEVNVLGNYYLLRNILPKMRDKGGNIILFGSNVSRIGLKNGSAYAASKAAVANLTRTIALEESRNNILINTVSPGPVMIDNKHFSEEYRTFREEYYKKELAQIPAGRLLNIDEILSVIDFLTSKNTYMTGEEIFLTGGKL